MSMHITDPARHATGNRPEAFTLIELLVVIAIIAILAGLSFPAVQGALSSGKKAKARNDVNQLAAAVKAFQLEYGRLPSAKAGSDETPAENLQVINALIGSNATLNPRAIVFFEAKAAKGGKAGLDASGYKDPWGINYSISLDTSYDNRISNVFTTVIVSSAGGSDDTNRAISNIK